MLSICKAQSWRASVTSDVLQHRQHEYPLFPWWRTTLQVMKCRLCWEIEVWPCSLFWIYCLSLLLACNHAVCKETHRSYVQGQIRMSKLCTGWECARPSMPQASSPANTPASTLLNRGMNALNTSGTLPAVLFAGLSVLTPPKSAPRSLYRDCPKHKKCSGEQNAKLLYKSNFWVITKTMVLRKNIQPFKEVYFGFISTLFFQCFMPQIGSKDVKYYF